jgi:hypothetical protein
VWDGGRWLGCDLADSLRSGVGRYGESVPLLLTSSTFARHDPRLLPTNRHALDMMSMQCCWEVRTCASSQNAATLPIPWTEVTPSCLRIQSRGAGWALSTPRVLAGFHMMIWTCRLAGPAALTFQLTLRACSIRRLPLALLAVSSRPRVRRPLFGPRPRMETALRNAGFPD